jgi:hypothetical protein
VGAHAPDRASAAELAPLSGRTKRFRDQRAGARVSAGGGLGDPLRAELEVPDRERVARHVAVSRPHRAAIRISGGADVERSPILREEANVREQPAAAVERVKVLDGRTVVDEPGRRSGSLDHDTGVECGGAAGADRPPQHRRRRQRQHDVETTSAAPRRGRRSRPTRSPPAPPRAPRPARTPDARTPIRRTGSRPGRRRRRREAPSRAARARAATAWTAGRERRVGGGQALSHAVPRSGPRARRPCAGGAACRRRRRRRPRRGRLRAGGAGRRSRTHPAPRSRRAPRPRGPRAGAGSYPQFAPVMRADGITQCAVLPTADDRSDGALHESRGSCDKGGVNSARRRPLAAVVSIGRMGENRRAGRVPRPGAAERAGERSARRSAG